MMAGQAQVAGPGDQPAEVLCPWKESAEESDNPCRCPRPPPLPTALHSGSRVPKPSARVEIPYYCTVVARA